LPQCAAASQLQIAGKLAGFRLQCDPEEPKCPLHRVGVNRIAVHSLRVDAQHRHGLAAGFAAGIEEYIMRHVAVQIFPAFGESHRRINPCMSKMPPATAIIV
jgi:hypothetical protein